MELSSWYHLSTENWFRMLGLIYPGVWIIVLFWLFAFGACIGSFLNVCIWRIPRGESLSRASSHCTVCGSPIHWYDNIPVISYLVLRGKCRSCKTPYSCSYFVVELVSGALTALLVVKTGIFMQSAAILPARMILIFLCIACALTDIRYRIVPDKLTYSGMILALISAFACPEAWGMQSRSEALLMSLASGIICGGILLLFCEICGFFSKEELIGRGDMKFICMCGMLIGIPGTFFSLLAGALGGTLFGVAVIRKFNAKLPFVPFIAFAALIWIFFDQKILDFYLSMFIKS